jgi:hypothetical protein
MHAKEKDATGSATSIDTRTSVKPSGQTTLLKLSNIIGSMDKAKDETALALQDVM